MIVWMLYSAFVALIIAAAARSAEWLTRFAGLRVRWIWMGALGLTVLLSAIAAFRGAKIAVPPPAEASGVDRGSASLQEAGLWWRVASVRRSVDMPLRVAAGLVRRAATPAADRYAAAISVLLSAGLVLALLAVSRRLRMARREWPEARMQGVAVCVAPRVGPVVLGVVRPEIVVPGWLLARSADEQRLVVTHEAEHVRARDPLLLALGWCAVAALPWNPALWFMLSRLRLAVELDCDARVLRRGAQPDSYGSLLIDVAQRASELRISTLALAADTTHLHQRILAMTPTVPRFACTRAGLAAGFALAGLLAACQARIPAEPVPAVPEAVPASAATDSSATPAPAVAEPPRSAASKSTGVVVPAIAPPPARTPAASPVDSLRGPARLTAVVYIDGVRSSMAAAKALDRERIESIEVLKGPYALQFYADPGAELGVVVITTKRVR
jgi:beta-lactamase regulating signal transducer with metallopeptidase domain